MVRLLTRLVELQDVQRRWIIFARQPAPIPAPGCATWNVATKTNREDCVCHDDTMTIRFAASFAASSAPSAESSSGSSLAAGDERSSTSSSVAGARRSAGRSSEARRRANADVERSRPPGLCGAANGHLDSMVNRGRRRVTAARIRTGHPHDGSRFSDLTPTTVVRYNWLHA